MDRFSCLCSVKLIILELKIQYDSIERKFGFCFLVGVINGCFKKNVKYIDFS